MRRVVMVVCAALLVVPLYINSRTGQNVSARPAFLMLSSGRMLIKVSGDVRYPGVYEVPVNELAATVIKMAIPVKPLELEMLPVPLQNGQAVTVSLHANDSTRITVGLMTVPERMVLGIPLDIASMNEADFDRLPGIGPALAKRIVTFRQLNGGNLQFNDLAAIEGIGEKKLNLIRKFFQPAEKNK